MKSLWLDMDGTIVNFAKSNLEDALKKMHDPSYYRTLEPLGNVMDDLGEAAGKVQTINIISGIPDMVRHSEYLKEYITTPEEYMQYYMAVQQEKEDWIKRYYGAKFFDLVQFSKASESKAHIVKERWYTPDTWGEGQFSRAYLVDDQEPYCTTWRKLGGKAYTVSKKNPTSLVIKTIMEER